ncbi:MAG: hypothetical protein ABR551_01330 [Gemmatimonadales bacterium]
MPTCRCLSLLVAGLLTACGLSEPSALPDPDYGTISAQVRGEPWVSAVTTDSIVAWYNEATGHLTIRGSHTEASGDATSLAMVRCGPLAPGRFAFAKVDNGPYGYAALALGAIATWSEPMRFASPHSDNPPHSFRELTSTGSAGDGVDIEYLDLDDMVIRGSFRFHAVSPMGYVQLVIHGKFSGRIFPSFDECAL